jgi:dephospho-CoA kinase
MPKLILGFAGMPGAGKGTAVKYIQEKYGASTYRFSTVLSDMVKRIYQPMNRENLIKMSEALRHYFGEDILAYVVEKDVTGDAGEMVVIDGVRRFQDLAALEPLPYFKLIAITAPPEVRFQRLKARGERANEKDMTWEQFQAEEQAPTETTIPPVMQRAAVTIDNSGDVESLKAQLDSMLEKFLTAV